MKAFFSLLALILTIPGFSQTEMLVWSDEFNGSGVPDAANWGYEIGNNGWGNNEIEFYTNLSQNARQENGVLKIEARKAKNMWTSARLVSKGKVTFTYGRLVFRAKLPAGSGTWPALWMLGSDIDSAGWPACGEVDVMEHIGREPTKVHCSLHSPSSFGNTVNTAVKTVDTYNTEFHNYQVNWTPEKIEFSIDSVLLYTYNPAVKNASTWPFNKPFFIIMNIAMGGNWGSDPQFETNGLKNGIDTVLTDVTMEVDYVRLYQMVSASKEIAALDNITVSSNPSSGELNIHRALEDPGNGVVLDATGRQVFTFKLAGENQTINLQQLPKGVYFLRLECRGSVATVKISLAP